MIHSFFSKVSFLFSFCLFFFGCHSSPKEEKIHVDYPTLIVSTEGNIMNFDLDNNIMRWQYRSDVDSEGNRNLFTINKQEIILPFESGLIVALDINSGKLLWKRQITGEHGIITMPDEPRSNIFMSQTLIHQDKVYIASIVRHSSVAAPALYCLDSRTGTQEWATTMPLYYNHYQPVAFKDYIFVSSAVFLLKYSKQGVLTSYGMYDDTGSDQSNQFPDPIYCRMQSDNNCLYIGDERGRFYCLELDKNANVNGDVMDPSNTFINNPGLFKWTFEKENFTFQKIGLTYLTDQLFISEVHGSSKPSSCIFALNKKTGKPVWEKIIDGEIITWSMVNDRIVGHNEKQIFLLDLKGNSLQNILLTDEFVPISNIEITPKGDLVFVARRGIVTYLMNKKAFVLTIPGEFNDNPYNDFQIQYFSNK